MKSSGTKTLYDGLATRAPESVSVGETRRTLAKETLDADDEALLQTVVIGA